MRYLVLLVTLTACATTPYPENWHRDGATERDLRMESAQCKVQAISGSSAQSDGVAAYLGAAGIFRNCMIGKGWERTHN